MRNLIDFVGFQPTLWPGSKPGSVYIVAPGSYTWEDGKSTREGPYSFGVNGPNAPILNAPQNLLDAIDASDAKAEPRKAPEGLELDTPAAIANVVRYLAHDAAPAIEGSGGDAQTYAVACEVRDMGISEAVALDLMLEHYNPRCIGPWEPDDLAVKVANDAGVSARQRTGETAKQLNCRSANP